jgi:hypothetical protein
MSAARDLSPPFRDGPFRYADAVAAGVSLKVLRGPRFRAPFRGVRVPADLPDTVELRARAASLVLPSLATFVDETAAQLFRLPIEGAQLHVRVPAGVSVPRLVGVRTTASLRPTPAVTVRGLRVVEPARLFVDLARRLERVELVVLGDAILNHGLATAEALAAAVQACSGYRWITRAREALAHLEPRSESPMESRLRMELVLRGLPRPVAG